MCDAILCQSKLQNFTYSPSHGTVALPGYWVAVTLVLAQTGTGAIGSMSPWWTRIVTPKLMVSNLLFSCQTANELTRLHASLLRSYKLLICSRTDPLHCGWYQCNYDNRGFPHHSDTCKFPCSSDHIAGPGTWHHTFCPSSLEDRCSHQTQDHTWLHCSRDIGLSKMDPNDQMDKL